MSLMKSLLCVLWWHFWSHFRTCFNPIFSTVTAAMFIFGTQCNMTTSTKQSSVLRTAQCLGCIHGSPWLHYSCRQDTRHVAANIPAALVCCTEFWDCVWRLGPQSIGSGKKVSLLKWKEVSYMGLCPGRCEAPALPPSLGLLLTVLR